MPQNRGRFENKEFETFRKHYATLYNALSEPHAKIKEVEIFFTLLEITIYNRTSRTVRPDKINHFRNVMKFYFNQLTCRLTLV